MRISIPLPPGYRCADVLAFHSRDLDGVAEQVTGERIRKGVLMDGVAVLLDVTLTPGMALCEVHADGAPAAPTVATVAMVAMVAMVHEALHNILALRIDPAPFLALAWDDLLLGACARRNAGLRIVQSATIFEALTWAIIGQQINLPFAIALRRSFILQAGRQHSSGLWCYPEAAQVAALDAADLTGRKFSRSKADTLLRVARLIDNGELDLSLPPDQLGQELLTIKGIGPWTVNYVLLRGYGYPDCSLHGDVAIRSAFQRLLHEDAKPDIARTQALLDCYRPHRTMAAACLWASLNQPEDD